MFCSKHDDGAILKKSGLSHVIEDLLSLSLFLHKYAFVCALLLSFSLTALPDVHHHHIEKITQESKSVNDSILSQKDIDCAICLCLQARSPWQPPEISKVSSFPFKFSNYHKPPKPLLERPFQNYDDCQSIRGPPSIFLLSVS